MTRGTLPALLFFILVQTATAADRLVSDTAVSADSDKQQQRSEYLGYVHALPSLDKTASIGLRAGYWRLDSTDDRVEFGALRVDHQRSIGPVSINIRAQQLFSDDWTPTLGAIAADYRITPRWTLSASGDFDVVDTVIAIRQHTRFDTYNVSTDYQLRDTVTLVGSVLQQRFSDGNQRNGGLARVIYSPFQLDGFTAQLRLRRLNSEKQGLGYFSPDRFEEAMALLQYGHALPGGHFAMTLMAGGGEQRIDGTSTTTVYVMELRTRGWFSDRIGLEGKAGCSNTGDAVFRATTDDYRYCYGTMTLLGAW